MLISPILPCDTGPMLKDNRVFFIKVRVIFIYCLKTSSIGLPKNTYHLYDQIYFDRRVPFYPSIRSELYMVRQFCSEKLIFMRAQCLLCHPRFIEVK